MVGHVERTGHATRRLEFTRMALPVADGQREQAESLLASDRRRRIGIEPAAQQDNG